MTSLNELEMFSHIHFAEEKDLHYEPVEKTKNTNESYLILQWFVQSSNEEKKDSK